MKKKGLLLVNLGTPDDPSPASVKKYLAEFLMDPYVIDIAWPLRFLLIYGIILNTRPKKSAHAYQQIWTERGSPLMFHTQDLCAKVSQALAHTHHVRFAMRYGQPSIEKVLGEMRALEESGELDEICVIPLYPQYALASTESSIQKVRSVAAQLKMRSNLRFVKDFYNDAPFIAAIADNARQTLADFRADHVLMSFHGVPERHVQKTDLTGAHCLKQSHCCEKICEANRYCYRAQSFATAAALARQLGLRDDQYTVSFQSRLGRTPWIKPYTDFELLAFPRRGVKRLAVFEPSFVADCLETLEEIGIRGQQDFLAAGGEALTLIPSLNSSDRWVRALCALATR